MVREVCGIVKFAGVPAIVSFTPPLVKRLRIRGAIWYNSPCDMKKLKIYLETTLFNYYFDEDRDAHADTVRLFGEIRAGKHEAYTSDVVTDELEKTSSPKREMMLGLIKEFDITVLIAGDSDDALADFYVAEGIIPLKYRTDGIHIAVAVTNRLDYIVSMNFKHIVKPKTKMTVNAINALRGYNPIALVSPYEYID